MAKLVTIGDSITQGFQSCAISRTDQSYPAILARCLGLGPKDFLLPSFYGEGGFPFNIEECARILELKYGRDLSGFEWFSAPFDVVAYLDRVEDYWERGRGSMAGTDADYHNLAYFGATVRDSYELTAGICQDKLANKDDWLATASQPFHRSALRVLNPAGVPDRNDDTQLGIAARIAKSEGIEHLIVNLGANNCLGTVVSLRIVDSDQTPDVTKWTLWKPKAFQVDYTELGQRLVQVVNLSATRGVPTKVYLATVPHVTIPPVTRGIMKNRGTLPTGSKYYDYYAYGWVRDGEFDPSRHPHLLGTEAAHIDDTIDQYNACIRDVANANKWTVVDLCKTLDDLAYRRNQGAPAFELPAPLQGLNTKMIEVGRNGDLLSGGLFSLDCVHPTHSGYSVIANEFVQAMHQSGTQVSDVDFGSVRRNDSLVSNPPKTIDDMLGALETVDNLLHFTKYLSNP